MADQYKDFFYNEENLSKIYNMLKGDEPDLKKDTVKKMIQQIEEIEYEDNNPVKLESSQKKIEKVDKAGSHNSLNELEKIEEESIKINDDVIPFEEYKNIFQKLYENSHDSKQIFLEGFNFLDRKEKGYIDIDDLKKLNAVFNNHFNEDDLEGLLEIAGKSDSKITFDNFLNFLINETN